MTALCALLCGQKPPYVFLSVWGPFGHRISKRVKVSGMTINADCPSTFAAWNQSYQVYRTGAVMFGAMTSPTLDAYRDFTALCGQR